MILKSKLFSISLMMVFIIFGGLITQAKNKPNIVVIYVDDFVNADWQTHSVQFTIQEGFEEVTFNLNGQSQGVYILQVEDVQGNVSVKKVLNN